MLQKNEIKILLLKKHSHSKCVSYCTWPEPQKIWVNFSQKNPKVVCVASENTTCCNSLCSHYKGQEPWVPIRRNSSCLCSCCKVGIMECSERNRKENKEIKEKQIRKKKKIGKKTAAANPSASRKDLEYLGKSNKPLRGVTQLLSEEQTGNRNPSACRQALGHKRKF